MIIRVLGLQSLFEFIIYRPQESPTSFWLRSGFMWGVQIKNVPMGINTRTSVVLLCQNLLVHLYSGDNSYSNILLSTQRQSDFVSLRVLGVCFWTLAFCYSVLFVLKIKNCFEFLAIKKPDFLGSGSDKFWCSFYLQIIPVPWMQNSSKRVCHSAAERCIF